MEIQNSNIWRGKNVSAEVLFSRAGLAQTIWVETPDGLLLFDIGDGALRDIIKSGKNPKDITAIFITHGHFDHIGGLYALLGFLRMVGRAVDLPVYVPEGSIEAGVIAESFLSIYRDSMPFNIDVSEIRPNGKITIGDTEVIAYPMVHRGSVDGDVILDRLPACGYRIEHGGEAIAISGDTGDCPELRELVKGTDLAIIEATYKSKSGISERMLSEVHLAEDVARKIGETAREFVLVHKSK